MVPDIELPNFTFRNVRWIWCAWHNGVIKNKSSNSFCELGCVLLVRSSHICCNLLGRPDPLFRVMFARVVVHVSFQCRFTTLKPGVSDSLSIVGTIAATAISASAAGRLRLVRC